nr:sigma-70 family RNA polymerase sigma factor [uncultured Flavonifractor sp.]
MKQEIDLELIQRCMDGDWAEADILLGAVERWSYYLCRKMLQNEEDARDATQEILLTVYQKLGTLKAPEAFWGWVRQITVNRCRNQLTRGPREQPIPEDSEGNSLLDTYEDLDQQKVPDQALDNAETQRMVQDLVDGLSPEQRLSVLLYYYDERSVKEIAQLMETSEGTVKSRLNYARKAIKTGVEGYEKQGVKLYGLSPLPFLLYFLRREAEHTALDSAAVQVMVQSTLAAGGTAAAAGGAGAAAGSAAASAGSASAAAGGGAAASGGAAAAGAVKTAAAAVGHGLAVKVTAVVLAGTVAVGGGYAVVHRSAAAPQEQEIPAAQETLSQPVETPQPIFDPEAPRKAAMLAALDEAADWALYAKLIDMDGDGTEELLIGGGQPSEYMGGDRVGYGLIAYTWDGETLTPVSLCKKTMPDLDEEVALFRRTTTGEIYVGYQSHTGRTDLRLEALSGCVRLSRHMDPDYIFYEYEEPFDRTLYDPEPPTVSQHVYEQHLAEFEEIERIIGVDYDVDPEQASLEYRWLDYWNPDSAYGDVVEQRPPLLKISSTLETVREQLQPAETAP